jgi:hypothetical protein
MDSFGKAVIDKMIGSVDWDSLHSTNQAAGGVPALLRELLFAETEEVAFGSEGDLSQEHLAVQGRYTDAAVAAVPIIFAALAAGVPAFVRSACFLLLNGFQSAAEEELDRTGLLIEEEMARVLREGTWLVFSITFDSEPEVSDAALRLFRKSGYPGLV